MTANGIGSLPTYRPYGLKYTGEYATAQISQSFLGPQHMLSDPRYSQAGKSLAENRTTELGRRLSMKIRFSSEPSQPAPIYGENRDSL